MSVVREAKKCFARQRTFANLNAFITPLPDSSSWRNRVKNAEARRDKGMQSFIPIPLYFSLCNPDKQDVR
jgi:hypothetical protein